MDHFFNASYLNFVFAKNNEMIVDYFSFAWFYGMRLEVIIVPSLSPARPFLSVVVSSFTLFACNAPYVLCFVASKSSLRRIARFWLELLCTLISF